MAEKAKSETKKEVTSSKKVFSFPRDGVKVEASDRKEAEKLRAEVLKTEKETKEDK